MSELLGHVREQPESLVLDSKKHVRRFRLTASAPLGGGRRSGKNSFVDSTLDVVQSFYGDVVQGLRPWTPKSPTLPSGRQSATETAGIDTRTPIADLPASQRRPDQEGRQGFLAPPDGPPLRPQWLADRPSPNTPD